MIKCAIPSSCLPFFSQALATLVFTWIFAACSIIDGLSGVPDAAQLGMNMTADGGQVLDAEVSDAGFTVEELSFTGEPPKTWTNIQTATIAYEVRPEAATITCKLSRDDVQLVLPSCKSPILIDTKEDGEYLITILAKIGSDQETQIDYRWNVDTVAPSIEIAAGPGDGTLGSVSSSSVADFEFITDETAGFDTFLCRFNEFSTNQEFSPCQSSASFTVFPGRRLLQVKARDLAGNESELAEWYWSYGETWKAVGVSSESTCGVRDDGRLFCWGGNLKGQLGVGNYKNDHQAQEIGSTGKWVDVVGGSEHFCALTDDKSAWCWGWNRRGQLGSGGPGVDNPTLNTEVSGGHSFKRLEAGSTITCGIDTSNSLYCWGQINQFVDVIEPEKMEISGNTQAEWTTVSVGKEHVCAITSNDDLYCWGKNNDNKLGRMGFDNYRPSEKVDTNRWLDVATSDHNTCAVRKTDGSPSGPLYCWGASGPAMGQGTALTSTVSTSELMRVGTNNWRSVFGGDDYFCAQNGIDLLFCWGLNLYGELGIGTTLSAYSPQRVGAASSGFKSVAVGREHSCGLNSSGAMYCWGSNGSGQLRREPARSATPRAVMLPSTLNSSRPQWSMHDSNPYRSCGVLDDAGESRIWCWGLNRRGELGDGTQDNSNRPVLAMPQENVNWVDVEVGKYNTFGIDALGRAWSWPSVSTIDPIHEDTDALERTLGRNDMAAFGELQMTVPVQDIESNQSHVCAIAGSSSDEIWCWGDNEFGQLGDANQLTGRSLPAEVLIGVSGPLWSKVSTGSRHTCALTSAGALWCWGDNRQGQVLGGSSGGQGALLSPTQVQTDKVWIDVVAHYASTCAINNQNKLYCWGYGEVGYDFAFLNPSLSGSNYPHPTYGTASGAWQKLHGAQDKLCAIDRDDYLWCWGGNVYGELGAEPWELPLHITDFPWLTTTDLQQIGSSTSTWSSVMVGGQHVCAVGLSDGTLYCWGDNRAGQLGTGQQSYWTSPGVIPQ